MLVTGNETRVLESAIPKCLGKSTEHVRGSKTSSSREGPVDVRTGNGGLYCTRKQEVAVSEVMRSSILDRLILRSIEERTLNRELVRKSKEKCDLNVQI